MLKAILFMQFHINQQKAHTLTNTIKPITMTNQLHPITIKSRRSAESHVKKVDNT
jgi:hypothetical protein